jgi:hypothetical protein
MTARIGLLCTGSVLAGLAVVGGIAFAAGPSGGAYVLQRTAVSSAGGASTGGTYALGGSVGQVDALLPLTGGAYRLDGGFWGGTASPTVDADPVPPAQLEFGVRIAGPNPFRASTGFAVTLPRAARLALSIYAVDGRLVRGVYDDDREAGRHVVHWDGKDRNGREVPPGVYLARVIAGPDESTVRVVRLD